MTFVIYMDQKGEWRWRLWAANRRVVADSGEGYVALRDCEDAVRLIQQYAPTAQVQVKRAA